MLTRHLHNTALAACLLCVSATGCAQYQGLVNRINPAPQQQQHEMKLNFAKAHEREGNLAKAESALREILAENPKNAHARHRLGVVLVRSGKPEEGLSALEEAVAAMPRDLDAHNDLGYAYLMQGNLVEAETLFRESLEISPNHSQSLNNLALVMGYQGQAQEAYTLFRRSMTEAEALANLGYVHSQRGEVDLAMQRYSQALNHDPSLRTAANGLIQISSVKKQAVIAREQRELDESPQTLQATHTEPAQPHPVETIQYLESASPTGKAAPVTTAQHARANPFPSADQSDEFAAPVVK